MERTQQDSRWSGFSDEELAELHAGATERQQNAVLPSEYRGRAGRLSAEMHKERRYREAERTSYRGPGLYRRWDGKTESVLGVAVHETDMGREYLVVIRRASENSPVFTAVPHSFFEGCEDGQRRFSYVEVEEES